MSAFFRDRSTTRRSLRCLIKNFGATSASAAAAAGCSSMTKPLVTQESAWACAVSMSAGA